MQCFYDGSGGYNVYYARCFKKGNNKEYLYALCNWEGKEVFRPSKKYALVIPKYYEERLFYVVEDFYTGKKGVIDPSENIIMPLVYNELLADFNGDFLTEVDNGEGISIGNISQSEPKCDNLFPEGDINSLLPVTSIVNTSTPAQSSTTGTQSKTQQTIFQNTSVQSSSQNDGLLFEGEYTDPTTGITMVVSIYDQSIYGIGMSPSFVRKNSDGTRVYTENNSSMGFSFDYIYYVTPSFDIYYDCTASGPYGLPNTTRTYMQKGRTIYTPSMNGTNHSNINSQYSSLLQNTNNQGLNEDQYQYIYQGYENIVIGILESFRISPDMNYGVRVQNMQTLRDCQNSMREIREEAAKYEIDLPQSSYETATP